VDDATVIGFTQTLDSRLRWVDYHEGSGYGIDHYAALIHGKDYRYGTHYGPHDLKVKEWGSGNTRLERAERHGLNFEVVPKLHIADGIDAARRLLKISEFDEDATAAPDHDRRKHGLIDALMTYRREWDERLATWRSTPVHDWASHAADMVRYRAVAYYDLSLDRKEESYDNRWSVYEADRPKEPDEYADWDVYSPT